MRIFLIGFMASGKTTVGKKLANKLELPFVDLDRIIEEKYNKTIRTIICGEGEQTFRTKEKEALAEVIQKNKSAVISTGGGTPIFFDNMDLMNSSGETVYLELDVDTLVDRLMNSKEDRPLLWGKNREELTIKAKELLQNREATYKLAKHKINGKNIKADSIIDLLKL
ncbi:MAG: shikimate kinase [Bacteroidales bacterium]|nr:shikimate kinase [Bacteroidales bacterium]